MHLNRFLLPAAAWLALGSFAIAASAQQPKDGPCQADLQKYCPDAQTAPERMRCMKEHEADLSQPCQQARKKMGAMVKKRLAAAKQACQGDIDKYCKDVQPGEGRIAACLKGHADDLAPSCKAVYDKTEALQQQRQLIKGFLEACRADSEKFCKDVEAGGGRKLRCLREHQGELTDSCKDAMGKAPKAPAKEPAEQQPEGSEQE